MVKSGHAGRGGHFSDRIGLSLINGTVGSQVYRQGYAGTPHDPVFWYIDPGSAISESSLGVLQITNHFRTQAAINLLQSLLTAVIIVAAFYFKGSIYTVLVAYLVG